MIERPPSKWGRYGRWLAAIVLVAALVQIKENLGMPDAPKVSSSAGRSGPKMDREAVEAEMRAEVKFVKSSAAPAKYRLVDVRGAGEVSTVKHQAAEFNGNENIHAAVQRESVIDEGVKDSQDDAQHLDHE